LIYLGPVALESELTALTNSLRKLHLALIEHTRIAYERVHGSVAGPGELLQLLTRDPEFAWLHPLSELMAWVDELLDPRRDPRPQPEEAAAVRNELSRMLGITHDPTHPVPAGLARQSARRDGACRGTRGAPVAHRRAGKHLIH